ncbi:MAG TPA: DUF1573 domain-containing protein, partial [Bacteroidales bacterium]|nr:DUF1573 domain-containing protein [Bacteroidales bacterium]
MWKIFLLLVLFSLAACSLKNEKDKQNVLSHFSEVTNVKFDTLYHNFGNLIQGEKASYAFTFKNIGSSNLVIKDAYSTCGCTVAKYTENAVLPESSGYV